jgi:hypothetical protein
MRVRILLLPRVRIQRLTSYAPSLPPCLPLPTPPSHSCVQCAHFCAAAAAALASAVCRPPCRLIPMCSHRPSLARHRRYGGRKGTAMPWSAVSHGGSCEANLAVHWTRDMGEGGGCGGGSAEDKREWRLWVHASFSAVKRSAVDIEREATQCLACGPMLIDGPKPPEIHQNQTEGPKLTGIDS